MKRPPLIVVLAAVVILALGETGGAVMSQLGPQTEEYARERVAARSQAHGLVGSPEYDDEVTARAVFEAEAGLSFFHTHGLGVGLIVFFGSTVVATAVPWRRVRGVLYGLLTAGGFFPLGYLVYAVAVLERGLDDGIELAERFVLIPLGSAVIVALAALALALAAGGRGAPRR